MTAPTQTGRLRPFRPVPFGRYTLLSPLATGGMGEIFLARLDGLQGVEKLCVIKKILPHLASDTDFVERFVNEAKILVKLSHGSIATVLDAGLIGGDPFIALEYVDGKDVRKVAARARDNGVPLPVTFILYVMSRVLDALAYAHRKKDDDEKELGLVHRDVSPQNILVSYEGEVKVIDFGLAKSRVNISKTHPSIILGKFLYMSPEQARHLPVDRRSDLYAVGLCLFELITGKNPFDEVSPGELMARVASPNIPSLGQVDPLCPGPVQTLVAKALQVDPSHRFQSAEEFRGKLLSCLLEIDPSAGPESVSRYMRETFSTEYTAERKLLASLREATRVGGKSGPQASRKEPVGERETAVVNLPNMQAAALSFAPTPRSKDDKGTFDTGERKRIEGETSPGLAVDGETRPAIDLAEVSGARRAKATPLPFIEPKTESGLEIPPGASPDTQPRVVLGSIVDEPTADPDASRRTLTENLPRTVETDEVKRRGRLVSRRWIWPAAVGATIAAVFTAGYFSMRDWIAAQLGHGEKVEAPAPNVLVNEQRVEVPQLTKMPVQPPSGTEPLPPGPPSGAANPPSAPKAVAAPGTDMLAPLADNKPTPRPPPRKAVTHIKTDSFHRDWSAVMAGFRMLTRRHNCDEMSMKLLCNQVDDLNADVMSADDPQIQAQLKQRIERVRVTIQQRLRAP